MAVATAVVSVTDQRNTFVAGDKYFIVGTLAITASPATYTLGGIVCSFLKALIKASRAPIFVQIYGVGAGTTGTLFEYRYILGTDASNGLLKIFSGGSGSTAGLAEFTDGTAIPADVSGDTINFMAIFNGQE
jgi:hypothetical protein